MKKIIFLTLLCCSMMVTSCSKDEDDYPSIVGAWYYDNYLGIDDVYEFRTGGKWYYYLSIEDYKKNDALRTGTYTYNGTSITLDGGFPNEVIWSENKKSFLWLSKQWTALQ